MGKDSQKQLISILSTALAAWAATKIAGSFLDEPEERGVQDDVKEALVQGSFSVAFTIMASLFIRNILGKRWES